MRTLDKYITKEFLKYYFLFVLFFVVIFVLTDFFISIGNLKKEASVLQMLIYYLLQIPYLIVILSPLSVIISTLFTISHFSSTNQLQAMQISGTSLKRATLPLFTAGLIIGFSLLFIDNTLVYEVNKISHKIKETNFVTTPETKIQKNIFVAVPPDYVLYIRSLNIEEGLMEDVLIYKKSSPPILTSAKKSIWKKENWLLLQGRDYILNQEPEERVFTEKILPIAKEPRYFIRSHFPPDKMSLSELTRYIKEYDKSGFDTQDLETEFQFKISSPFANFILILVTIPLGIILKRGRGASLGVGLVMSLGYYELIALLKSMGKTGAINPFLSAWIPSGLFLVVGIYLLFKME